MKLSMPLILSSMTVGEITKVHVAEGDAIKRGTVLFEVLVDLSSVVQMDCPPISSHRFVSRESTTVSRVAVNVGEVVEVGGLLAEFDSPADRQLRCATIQSADSTLSDIFGS